jgi:hypothetical protein
MSFLTTINPGIQNDSQPNHANLRIIFLPRNDVGTIRMVRVAEAVRNRMHGCLRRHLHHIQLYISYSHCWLPSFAGSGCLCAFLWDMASNICLVGRRSVSKLFFILPVWRLAVWECAGLDHIDFFPGLRVTDKPAFIGRYFGFLGSQNHILATGLRKGYDISQRISEKGPLIGPLSARHP